jgi:hypothetical protein
MSWQEDPLAAAGIDIKIAIAGAMGGIVRWVIKPHPGGLLANVGLVLAGCITAAYATPIFAYLIDANVGGAGSPSVFMLAAAYLIGLSGEFAMRGLMSRWRHILFSAVGESMPDSDDKETAARKRRQRENDDYMG